MSFSTLVFYTGSGFLAFYLVKVVLWLVKAFFASGKSIKKYSGKNKWAIVTGATGSIGAGFCKEFASHGSGIILVSRNKTKLDALASKLKDDYNVSTMVVVIDFITVTSDDYERLANRIKDLNVTVLVNNVGITHLIPFKFHKHEPQDVDDIVKINIDSLLKMCQLILPGMVANKNGLIINLSSYTSHFALPMMSTYSATKAFINNFSQGLHYEYMNDGITVMSLIPFYVVSAMSRFKKPSFTVCTGRRLAKDALKKIGMNCVCNPYWVHECIFYFTTHFVPTSVMIGLARSGMKMFQKKMLLRKKRIEDEAAKNKDL